MLVKGVATGDPGQSSSGWVEYLKTMTKTKKKVKLTDSFFHISHYICHISISYPPLP